MTTLAIDEHGTYSRYTSGRCRCDECRAAARAYMREYRRTHAARRQEDRLQTRDYSRALGILRDRHRAEFEAIYAEIRGAS